MTNPSLLIILKLMWHHTIKTLFYQISIHISDLHLTNAFSFFQLLYHSKVKKRLPIQCPVKALHSSPSRHLLSCQQQLSKRHLAFTFFQQKWTFLFPLCNHTKRNVFPSIFINVFRWLRQWCNLCQTGSVFLSRLWTKSVKTSCVLESSRALCIKISAQVERRKIRSVSPYCIINTPLFISLPIEFMCKKMLLPINYWWNFLALHVEKAIKKSRHYTNPASCWIACLLPGYVHCQTQQNTCEMLETLEATDKASLSCLTKDTGCARQHLGICLVFFS